MALWLIRAGKSGEYERNFFVESRVYLVMENRNSAPRRLRAFQVDMKVGDWVIVPRHGLQALAVGLIGGEYEFRVSGDEKLRHSRTVEWVTLELPFSLVDQDLLASFRSASAGSRIRRDRAETRICNLLEEHSLRTSGQHGKSPDKPLTAIDRHDSRDKTNSSLLRRKLRDRDILDYVALTSACITLTTRLAGAWRDPNEKSTAAYIILLALLGLLVFLELRAGTGSFLRLPPAITVPLILISIGVTAVVSAPQELMLTLAATALGISVVFLFAIFYKLKTGMLGFDLATFIAIGIGSLFVGCKNSYLFFCLAFSLATLYYVPHVLTGRISSKTPVPVIPFVVLAAIISRMPIAHDTSFKYRRFVVHDEITAIDQFILDSKRQAAANERLATMVNSAYEHKSPRLLWTLCGRPNWFEDQIAVRDIDGDFIFIISIKTKPYKVVDIRHSTCPCEL